MEPLLLSNKSCQTDNKKDSQIMRKMTYTNEYERWVREFKENTEWFILHNV